VGGDWGMENQAILRAVDAVTITVPDLDQGLAFYRDRLGHQVLWRNDAIGQVGLLLPDSGTEIVLALRQSSQPNWLVASADDAADVVVANGGSMVEQPFDIPVGRAAVVADPFGNELVLVDLSTGRYRTDEQGHVWDVHSGA